MKLFDPSDETIKLVEGAIQERNLNHLFEIKILAFENLKSTKVFDVKKAGDLPKHLAGFDVVIYVNEWLLELFSDIERQKMLVEEALDSIHFDYEKEKIVIMKPDIATFASVLKKFGNVQVVNTKEAINLAVQSKIDEAKEAKKEKLAAREAKKRNKH